MATNVNAQVLSCYRGEDVAYDFAPSPATTDPDITGFTLVFTLSDYPGQDPVVLTIPSGSITITDATAGLFTVPLTRAQSSLLLNSDYYYDVWNTVSGSYERLAGGQFTVFTPEYLPIPPV